MRTSFGGPIEYVALLLLAMQFFAARPYLKRCSAAWPRALYLALLALLGFLWATTLAAVALAFSGVMYSSPAIPALFGGALTTVGYLWIGFSSIALAVLAIARFLQSKVPALHSPSRRRWLGAASLAAIAAPVAATTFGVVVERHRFLIRELDLPVSGLHPDLEGFRISQVSDLHVSPFLSVREAARAIDMANELQPHLALFTGDLISEFGDPLDPAIRELVRLRGELGVLGCMGNHEEYVGCQNYLEREAARSGLLFLRDAATQVRRGSAVLNIAGVDYQRRSHPRGYLPGAERHILPGATNILLSHNPDTFPAAIQRGFHAVLSGHTHGGQVNVEILHRNVNPARFRTPFTSGLYRQQGATCFVTNGIGTIGIPVRLGAPPEIALLRLRRA